MGSPNHYGLELPTRCLSLLEALWPHAEGVFPTTGNQALGPLTATFLLSMAMPIINLPIERVERRNGARVDSYVDERNHDTALAGRMNERLGGSPIGNAPFFVPGHWSFYQCQVDQSINIADGFPAHLAQGLEDPAAIDAASALQGSLWSSILRNSLAHGGVAYLDRNGYTASEAPTYYLAFISGNFEHDECGRPIRLRAVRTLRISMTNFMNFLREWVRWLNNGDENSHGAQPAYHTADQSTHSASAPVPQ